VADIVTDLVAVDMVIAIGVVMIAEVIEVVIETKTVRFTNEMPAKYQPKAMRRSQLRE